MEGLLHDKRVWLRKDQWVYFLGSPFAFRYRGKFISDDFFNGQEKEFSGFLSTPR